MRTLHLLNPGWRFHPGDLEYRNFGAIHQSRFKSAEWMKAGNHGVSKPGYPDEEWGAVDLPHDFVIEGSFTPDANQVHGSLPVDVAWYRKVFELPAEDGGKRLRLEFDGAYRDCSVWLNGHFVGRHLSGYTSFAFDVTELCNVGGLNALAVRVDAREFELWSYEGGGIYRDVRLVKTHPVHVGHWGVCVRTDVAHEPSPKSARVSWTTQVANALREGAEVEVRGRIVDPEGRVVAEARTQALLEPGLDAEVSLSAELKSPVMWSVDSPECYVLRSEVELGGEVVDAVETPFGIRSVQFDAKKGFSLNGMPMKLKGVCNHQDHAGVGIAIPDRLQEWRIERLKEMGCNALRTSHNPPTPALLDICDRLGILVMDEARVPGTTPEFLDQFESLIRRDRNHPSVILWSLGNEEMNIQENAEGVRILQRMQDLAHRLDPTRLCTYSANCDFNEIADNFDRHGFRVDVFGANYTARLGDDGKLFCDGARYDEFHQKYPDWPLLGGETGGSAATRGLYGVSHYEGRELLADEHIEGLGSLVDINPKRARMATAYNETMTPWGRPIEDTWRDCADREFLGGTFLWTGFDYRGETYPFGWPAVVTRYGLLDLCGFPKDSFYYYQAWWSDQPVLHLLPHWNWEGREGEIIDVWCYGNCASVELLLNGVCLGHEKMPRNGKLAWEVAFAPGKLEAVGYDEDGREALREVVETTGNPAAIRLIPDRTTIIADGRDLAMVRVEVLDAAGRIVPDANDMITFGVEGPAQVLGVGNGDPISHEADKAEQRKVYHGLAQVLVQGRREAGDVRLMASSPGLQPAEAVLRFEAPAAAPLIVESVKHGLRGEAAGGANAIDGAL